MRSLGHQHFDQHFHPVPRSFERIAFTRTFIENEFRRLSQSVRPETMDQRWYSVLDNDWLYIVRSWTDRCFFQLKVNLVPPHQIVEARTSRSRQRYRTTDASQEIECLNQALDEILTAESR